MKSEQKKLSEEARKLDAFISDQGKPALAKTLLVIVIVLAAIWQMWGWAFPSGTWRYRMTVTVETPEGIKTGSVVREVTVQRGLGLFPEMGPRVRVQGEAVVIDLGKRGTLFALMRGGLRGVDYARTLPFEVFPYEHGGTTARGIAHYSRLKNARARLKPEQYPMFVSFRNIEDPKTVDRVFNVQFYGRRDSQGNYTGRKAQITDRLEKVFGNGTKIKEVTVEMTKDLSTRTIEKILPWLSSYYDKRLDGHRFGSIGAENLLANDLSAGDFLTGSKGSE